MERSKIIIDLIRNEIDVVQAMDILYIMLQDIKDTKIKKWLENEINGYSKKASLPEYRILESNVVGTYIAGNLKCTNQPIPLKPELIKEYTQNQIRCSLNEIQQMAIAEKESKSHMLEIPMHSVLATQISMINGEVISAHKELSLCAFTNILNKLKRKILNIFLNLEKEYGNLDNYYIDFSNKQKEQKVIKNIINIINDNSFHIGNENQIESSKIGVGNEN